MPIPSAEEEVQDFGLGFTPPAILTAVVFGVASLGTPLEPKLYSSISTLRSERGEGAGVECCAEVLSKGGPAIFIGADPSIAASMDDYALATWGTPGSNGAITRSGNDGPAISLSGAPKLPALFKIEITTAGILGTSQFRWSIDDGATWIESSVATAASVALGTTGVTANFSAGSYVQNETYSWTATAGGGYITASGDATIDARIRVEILTGGANGVATFRYNLDGYDGDTESERTYSETLTVPSGDTFAIPNLGVTLTFDDTVPHVAGDVYEINVRSAAWNATDLADGFEALHASGLKWRFFTAVTSANNGDAAAHATLAAALQSQLATLATTSKYRRGMIPCDQGDEASDVATAFGNVTAIRCLTAFGKVRRTTQKPFPGYALPVTHSVDVIASRAVSVVPSTDLKRVRSGSLDGVLKIFRDEYLNPTGLDDLKITTLRTYDELEGFYITQGRLKSPSGSDFKLWPHGVLMDIACEAAHARAILTIGQGVRTNNAGATPADPPAGSIDERDAVRIEEDIAQAVVNELVTPINAEGFPGYVQQVRVRVDRTHNVLQTGVILYEVGIRPLGYVDFIRGRLGYVVALPAAA